MTYDIEQVKSWADRGEVIGSMVVKEIIEEYTLLVQEHEAMRRQLTEFARLDVEPKYLAWPSNEFAQKARGVLSTLRPAPGADEPPLTGVEQMISNGDEA